MNTEIWKDIVGYEGYYQVSNIGRVKSLFRYKKVLKGNVTTWGYLQVNFRKNGKSRYYSIHRLVAQAFIPNIKQFPCVDHIDGDKSNNHVENLRWCTQKDNLRNPITLERNRIAQKNILDNLDKYPNRKRFIPKKVNQYTIDGVLIKTWDSILAAAECNKTTSSKIILSIKNKWLAARSLWTYYDGKNNNIEPYRDRRFRKNITTKII